MPDDIPDWLDQRAPLLDPGRPPGGRSRDAHLSVLRELLRADHLKRADWSVALSDVARMAQRGLHASSAMLATFEPRSGRWSARTSDGQTLADEAISTAGSTAVLERVRRSDQPLLTSGDRPLEVSSMSVVDHGIESVLAVPIHWWDMRGEGLNPTFGGCLYAHRTADQRPFAEADIDLVMDIARLAEPTLNVLRHLDSLEAEMRVQREQLAELQSAAAHEYGLGALRTQNPRFGREVLDLLRRIATADRVGLLILGPSGSGKSFLARSYHYACPRAQGPFVTLDCSQITSATTLGAELFGYAPNSGYANAPPRGRPGKAQLADGGSLFLDEIGALPSDLQQRLLRMIQEGAFSPLGGSDEITVDIQIVAATNEPLATLVERGEFREDLYWRVCEVTVELPPLDERLEDIPNLARSFLESARQRFGKTAVEGFSEAAMAALIRHPWSRYGNIRGLEHVVTRAVLLAPPDAKTLGPDQLQFEAVGAVRTLRPPLRPSPATRAAERRPATAAVDAGRQRVSPATLKQLRPLLERKLEEHGGRVAEVAEDAEVWSLTGHPGRVPTSTLYAWIRDFDLKERLAKTRHRRRKASYAQAVAAIRDHGSASAAARALGISRDALLWPLRKAQKTVADVLADE